MTGSVFCKPGCACGRHGRKAAKRIKSDSGGSCIVSYRSVDGATFADFVGVGRTLAERVHDADDQLPRGEWLRTSVSTPASIFMDLQGRDVAALSDAGFRGVVFVGFEGKTVRA